MKKLSRVIEITINVAVIIVMLALGYTLITRYISPPPDPINLSEIEPKQGTKLEIKDVDFSKSNENLLLVLSTKCRFCTENLPFYRQILALNSDEKKLRVLGVFLEDSDAIAPYLKEHDLALDEVITIESSQTIVRGTPTLILTDKEGSVLDRWYGKIRPETEREVLDHLFDHSQVERN